MRISTKQIKGAKKFRTRRRGILRRSLEKKVVLVQPFPTFVGVSFSALPEGRNESAKSQ